MRVRRKWTAAEIAKLCDWWATGYTIPQIASRLHRSRASVSGAIERNRLGRHGGARARRCLTCARLFQPAHRFNRICDGCKETDEWRSGNDWEIRR